MSLKDRELKIQDFGPGIPEKVLSRVGEPYNAGATGTGLGLAWVKTLCDRNDWIFEIESSSTGTTVRVKFFS